MTDRKLFMEYSQGRYLPRNAQQVVSGSNVDEDDAVRLAILLVNKSLITPEEFLGIVRHDPDFSIYDGEWVHATEDE